MPKDLTEISEKILIAIGKYLENEGDFTFCPSTPDKCKGCELRPDAVEAVTEVLRQAIQTWNTAELRDWMVTRFEVIDEEGRTYARRPVHINLSYQDSGRTLKVFVNRRT